MPRQRNRRYAIPGLLALTLLTAILITCTRQQSTAPPTPPAPPAASVTKAGPPELYPDPALTPGFANPDITQDNVADTICNPAWSTRSIRPPTTYTTRLKREQLRELGLTGALSEFEEDHFISLELGGHPTDPRNLWPEPYNPKPGARQKDVVENYLHKQVCAGTLTLKQAQDAISADWYKVYLEIRRR
ncbi:MAG: hypothetical protein ABI759_31355 [Candidatus Solibacter sp.]